MARELLYTLLISIIIAYILNPLVNYLEKIKIKRIIGVILVYLALGGIITLVIYIVIPNMFNELKVLINDLPLYFKEINNTFNKAYNIYINNINNLPEEFQSIKEGVDQNIFKIQEFIINMVTGFTSLVFSIFSKIISIILIPVLTFYFLKDKDYFKKKITLLIPKKYRNEVISVSREINKVLGSFVRGQLIVATFIGIATSIGLFFLKVKFSIVIGMLAGIFSIIPYFGPIIGIVPAILFALLDTPIKVAWVILLFIGIQQFEGDILSPKIVGNSVGLHPVTVMVSLLIGGSIMGMLGMLLAVPIVAVLRIVINSVVDRISRI